MLINVLAIDSVEFVLYVIAELPGSESEHGRCHTVDSKQLVHYSLAAPAFVPR